jgi:hypothetical protein
MKFHILKNKLIIISLLTPSICLSQITIIAKCLPTDFYRANIQTQSSKITQYLENRKIYIEYFLNQRRVIVEVIKLKEIYGLGIEAQALVPKVQEIDRILIRENQITQLKYNELYIEQGFLDIQFSKDPRRLSEVLAWHTGAQIDIQPRYIDCTYAVMSNGSEIIKGLTDDELIDYVKKIIGRK